jgi:hypothetical protein
MALRRIEGHRKGKEEETRQKIKERKVRAVATGKRAETTARRTHGRREGESSKTDTVVTLFLVATTPEVVDIVIEVARVIMRRLLILRSMVVPSSACSRRIHRALEDIRGTSCFQLVSFQPRR